MAVIHGQQGKVTFAGGATANVISWSVEAVCSIADGSVMSNVTVTSATHWKDSVAGYNSWTATVECLADDGGLDPDLAVDFIDVDGITCVFIQTVIAQSGRKYTGEGIITGISITADKDDVEKVTYTVQGSGALTEAQHV